MSEGFSYSMSEAVDIANLAYTHIEKYLSKFKETHNILNVENDENYQNIDVDMVWTGMVRGELRKIFIEIKGDRYHRTGNYFFETISNDQKNTPGCFLYTQANYLFYYFVFSQELHILPMPATREWFLQNEHSYRLVKTSTNNDFGHFMYNTLGKLVPIQDVKKAEIAGMKIVKLKKSLE